MYNTISACTKEGDAGTAGGSSSINEGIMSAERELTAVSQTLGKETSSPDVNGEFTGSTFSALPVTEEIDG